MTDSLVILNILFPQEIDDIRIECDDQQCDKLQDDERYDTAIDVARPDALPGSPLEIEKSYNFV